MIMPLDELLQRWVKVTPGQKLFLSVYLDLRPDRSGKKLYPIFLKDHLPELFHLLPRHSPERSFLTQDIKRLQKYLEEDLDPAAKGIALFVCSSDELFVSVPMPLPPENALHLAPYPYLFSLCRQNDLYQTYTVIVAASRQARIFLVRLGRLVKQLTLSWEDKHTTRFGRMGWSLPRFERHQKEHLKQRAKEITENWEKLVHLERTEYVFGVAEEGMDAELKKQISSAARQKLIPLASCASHDPDHKVLAAAASALQEISRKEAEALARHILQEAEPLGRGTAGPEPTLSALQHHQIERLVLDTHFKATGWRCQGCAFLGIGGSPSACPLCRCAISSANLREEIIVQAKMQNIGILFTENFSPLLQVGGIAAQLKYKSSSKRAGRKG
jgi:hypothetical protein